MNRFPGLTATFALTLATVGFTACGPDPGQASLQENVSQAFATCNEAKIKMLAAKHNVQLAFRPCGNNTFTHFSWAPDGLHLYFQLLMTGYVMDADAANKATTTLPTGTPHGPGAWLTGDRVALPVESAEGSADAVQMALFTLPALAAPSEDGAPAAAVATQPGQLHHLPMPGFDTILETTRGPSNTTVWFLAERAGEARTIWQLDTSTGDLSKPLEWLSVVPDTFTYSVAQNTVVIGIGDTITLYDATTGVARSTHEHATRGSLDTTGRWLAVEYKGDPVSLYYQRSWGELSEQARAREARRAENYEKSLPEWMPKNTQPPTLGMIDLEEGHRWEFTAFLGDRFQWYEAAPGWASFVLWGFEGKEFKRNVALTDLRHRLVGMEANEERLGARRYLPPGTAPTDSPQTPPEGSAPNGDTPEGQNQP